MSSTFLSIIIPARNEASRLPQSLERVISFLDKQPYSSEIVVLENGSSDRTLALAQQYAQKHPQVHIYHEDLAGKGRAIRRGVYHACGTYKFIADADFSMPVEQINRFLPPACDFDIAIASREAPGAVRYGEPPYRHFTGRVFNFFIRLLALPGLKDTQCGFKCFRAAITDDIFRQQTLVGWSFDVELLVIARRHGYSITEIGIPWTYTAGSNINIFRDSGRMFLDLLKIRRNAIRGMYDPD